MKDLKTTIVFNLTKIQVRGSNKQLVSFEFLLSKKQNYGIMEIKKYVYKKESMIEIGYKLLISIRALFFKIKKNAQLFIRIEIQEKPSLETLLLYLGSQIYLILGASIKKS